MQIKQSMTGLGVLCFVAAGLGYGGALTFVGPTETETASNMKNDGPNAVLSLGQFTIPIFDGDRIRGVLLAQINIEAEGLQQMQSLSRNKAQIRSLIINSFFAMEKEGLLMPETLSATAIAGRLKGDLETAIDSEKVRMILIDRLLIQENGRAYINPA